MPTELAKCHARWMIRRDMAEILQAERLANGLRWSEDQFLLTLRNRNCNGRVAERGEIVVGHIVYELSKHKFQVLNLCVHPEWQRSGYASAMIGKLKEKVGVFRDRRRIVADVPESKLAMQLFLRSQGFRAVPVGDVYRFTF